jgi:type I restriction enzyme R subunit
MVNGEKVASGDRLGKTIIFAKNQLHAEYIEERFNANYPEYKGLFARIITFKTQYAQSLIDDFSLKDKLPHIAISVDMMDTGIDVPEVLNLVFFKIVRSKTKFLQMIGRGTRLCMDLYAPGVDKKFFNIFDFCQNLQFFSQDTKAGEGKISEGLNTKLFRGRVVLLQALDDKLRNEPNAAQNAELGNLRDETAGTLHDIVANMTLDNFIVRPKRLYVEKYMIIDSWESISKNDGIEIAEHLAILPSQLRDQEEEAKQFDLLLLTTQLELLTAGEKFEKFREKIVSICHLLELQDSIPAVRAQMPLIQSINADDWWADVTVAMLENARKNLRLLVKLIEKSKRPIIYTNFEDSIGESELISFAFGSAGLDYERFKEKARLFLKAHENHLAIQRLRRNKPITANDLAELEAMLLSESGGKQDLVDRAKAEASGVGLFVRSLVGLDHQSAMEAMDLFLKDKTATANQLQFVNMIVEELTLNGAMLPERIYEAPFTNISASGPDNLFPPAKLDQLIDKILEIRALAAVAA